MAKVRIEIVLDMDVEDVEEARRVLAKALIFGKNRKNEVYAKLAEAIIHGKYEVIE